MKFKHAAVVGAIALTSVIALAGCSSNGGTTTSSSPKASAASDNGKVDSSLTGTITAGGSSAQANAQTAWTAAFTAQASGVTVNYDKSQGSGGGVTNWLSGSYDFAGSDAALNAAQYQQGQTMCSGDPMDLPTYLSGVALIYNLPGVKLQLSSATVAKIFTLQVKTWNDPAIAADNPGATLPSSPITVITRSDGSGTTANFTKYLHDTQPSIFTQAVGTAWPVAGTSGQQGGSGVVTAVTSGANTIGYADQSSIGTATSAKIQMGTGKDYVAYSAKGATNAFDTASTAEPQGKNDLTQVIDYSKITSKDSYAIPLLSYDIVCPTFKDAAQGKLAKAYLGFLSSATGQAISAKNAGSAPLPSGVISDIAKSVATIK